MASSRLHSEIANLPIEVVFNENWASGLSASLRAGLENLLKREPEIAAVMLADQPLINSRIIYQPAEIFERGTHPPVVCRYEETVGVPASSHALCLTS